jgi:hypothetical protein
MISTADLKRLVNNRGLLSWKLEQIRTFLLAMGSTFPMGLLDFFEDISAVEWIQAYLESPANQPFELVPFTTALMQMFGAEVRPRAVVALEDLMTGRVLQGSDSVARYSERFNQRARVLVHESQASLCKHYVAGLHPALRRLCVLDRDGKEWESVHALQQFALVEELRLTYTPVLPTYAAPPVRPHSHPSASRSAPPVVRPSQWRPSPDNKRPRAASASLAPPCKRVPAVGKPQGCLDQFWGADLAGCEFFGVDGPLTEGMRKVLREWGICFWCRRGQHLAGSCPHKGKGKGKAKGDDGAGPSVGEGGNKP